MHTDYLQCFPKPFLDDLVHGRMIPIVGAGLSRNAVTPPGTRMPLWDELGHTFAEEMTGYPFAGTLDAISAYAHEFGRTLLIERLAELLLVHSAKPGMAHEAFCSLPFTTVCTTNFDFLLEQQYLRIARFCRPIIDEDQLSIAGRDSDIVVLKLHGDLHHPQRLVVTEDDYSRFLDTYPLLATYLANLLISRTPFLIGYSLDDPDFRQVWQVVNDRLGRLRRPAYALAVDASPSDISRFARRGVRLISLPGPKANYGQILAAALAQLREHWSQNIVPVSQVVQEESLEQLSLPPGAKSRLCFFSVPVSLLSFYREQAYPIAQKHGFVPVSANDMISPGDNWLAKVETLIARSEMVVVDASTRTTMLELEIAHSKLSKEQVFVIVEESVSLPSDLSGLQVILRPPIPSGQIPSFLESLDSWLGHAANSLKAEYLAEPERLLQLKQFRAAVMSAIVLFEVCLRDKLLLETKSGRSPMMLRQLVNEGIQRGLVNPVAAAEFSQWMSLRNSVTHSLVEVSEEQATQVVNGVLQFVRNLDKPRRKPSRRRKK